jgi:DNA-binding FadR family transcriptional regulator
VHVTHARSAVFAPIGDEGRALRVHNRLAEAIRSGVLADGERLPSEQELAQMLGVATVTAREALVALRTEGLVATTRGRGGGSFVCRPASEDLTQGALARMSRTELRDRGTQYTAVLASCAEIAAERADPDEVDALRDLIIDPGEKDVGRWKSVESELYLCVTALTRSARLTRDVIRLEANFGTLLRLPLAEEDFRLQAAAHHGELIEALAAGDGSSARACVRGHLGAALERVADLHDGVR